MRWLTHFLLTGLILTASTLYAFNPKEGWYAGLIVGANYAKNVPFTYDVTISRLTRSSTVERSGQLGHDIMVTVGGQMGYRLCDNFRLEFEAVYNSSPYSYLRFENVTFHDLSSSSGYRMNGATQSGVATFNAFYDFFGDYSSKAVPYLGLGVGYAYIANKLKFFHNDVQIQPSARVQNFLQENFGVTLDNRSRSGLAGQAIVGISYYLDDYAYFALDGRYMVSQEQTILERQTRRTSNQFDVKYTLYTVNLLFNSAFDCA
jgi:opacity protein-like surface antigen